MKTLLLLLILVLVPASPSLSTPEKAGGMEPSARQQSTLASAISLLHRWEKRGPVTDPEQITAAEQALVDLDLAWIGQPVWRVQIQISWLDFLARSIRIADQVAEMGFRGSQGTAFGVHGEADLRRRAASILRRRLPEIRTWLTREVLLGGDRHPLGRQVAACEVVKDDDSAEVVLALFSCTRSAPLELVNAAVGALAGRDLVEVHERLVELLTQADEGKIEIWRGAIERHFAGVQLSPDDRELVEEIRGYVQEALADEDWRQASRGVSVARCLPHQAAFPTLIAGMEVWIERADGKRAVRRVLGELEGELRRRSGRQLGLRPDRWMALWEAYQQGEVTLTGQNGEGGLVTQADFFGLRPVTDRVTFVLDRSGSMDTVFGDSQQQSRLREAADRLSAFLEQMGPDTRFDVVVFSDEAQSWKKTLQPASKANIENAWRWVIKNGAKGGTHLKAGVLAAMHIDKAGKIDLEALEADTVIVLCDGATAEGPGWVLPLLRRTNDEGRLIFHAVQIGSGGDGTLELLCAETGGNYVRVEG